MSTEQNKGERNNGEAQRQLKRTDLAQFIVDDYLRPYGEKLLPAGVYSKLGRVVPRMFDRVFSAIKNVSDNKGAVQVTVGGTSMEVFHGLLTEEEYADTKKHLREAYRNIDESNHSIPASSLKVVAMGDPDVDLALSGRGIDLEDIYGQLRAGYNVQDEKLGEHGISFIVETEEAGMKIEGYVGSAYPGSVIKRLYLQVYDNGQKVFHIDITQPPTNGMGVAVNRRMYVGTVHDTCRADVEITSAEDGKTKGLLIPTENPPDPNEPTVLDLKRSGKDEQAWFEITMRELRKKFSHLTSKVNASHYGEITFDRLFFP